MKPGKCRITGEPLTPVIDFGELYINNFVSGDPCAGPKFRAKLGLGPTGLLQMWETYDQDTLYKTHYWYQSGINERMRSELQDIVQTARDWVSVGEGDTVLDIGANDGTLLSFWKPQPSVPGPYRVGIDPAVNLAKQGRTIANIYLSDYFTKELYWNHVAQSAKVVTSIAMFYDLDDPVRFVKDVRNVLQESGIWICQLSYTPLMLAQNEFCNISDEHICYYSLFNFKSLVESCGFRIVDVELNDTNSGSFRAIMTPQTNNMLRKPRFSQEVGKMRVEALLSLEKSLELKTSVPYVSFQQRVQETGKRVVDFLHHCKQNRKTVAGLGASTKGNTLLQVWGITPDLLPCIGERSEEKVGLKTVGSGIPIVSEEQMRATDPDYLFCLPYHFAESIIQREHQLLKGHCRLVLPLPQLEIIEV